MCENDEDNKGAEDMAKLVENAKIDVEQSISKSLDEVQQIREGKLPKRSYKNMISSVREKLSEES